MNRMHHFLSLYPLDHVVRVQVFGRWADIEKQWYEWLELNLTGSYHLKFVNELKRDEKYAIVSFSSDRDAALFKLFFG